MRAEEKTPNHLVTKLGEAVINKVINWAIPLTAAVLLVPLLFLADGLVSIVQTTPRSTSQRLLNIIHDDYQVEKKHTLGDPLWLYDEAVRCGYRFTHNDKYTVDFDTTLKAVAINAGWISYKEKSMAIYESHVLDNLSNRFSRTVLSDCLSTLIYAKACKLFSSSLLNRVKENISSNPPSIIHDHDAVFERARCSAFRDRDREEQE